MALSTRIRSFTPIFLLLIALVSTFFVYQRGLYGTFVFDDGPNIVSNARLVIHDLKPETLKQAAFSSSSGPLMRPVSMASFALNYYATGFDPYYFKLTNLIIHLLNGIGIFVLTVLLLNFYRKRFQPKLPVAHAQWVSLAIAAAWLLHPFNLTSVLYIVQRMTSLSAFFSIWGLCLYLWGRIRLYEGKDGVQPVLASLLLFTPLASLSKETGALLPILMLTAEITLFNFQAEKRTVRRFLTGFFTLSVAIPAAGVLVYIAAHPEWVTGGYAHRAFTLPERLMTEARVMWFYIFQIILPSTAKMGIFHDDIVNSRGLLQPVSTLFSVAGILALLGLSFVARKKAPLVTFGLLFFLAGHVLESTVLALEIAHEHRNYLPMYGILLTIFYPLLHPLHFTDTLRLRQAAALLLIGLFSFNTYARAGKWSNPFDLIQTEVMHHPNSPRAQGEMGNIYAQIMPDNLGSMEMNYLSAQYHLEKAAALDENNTEDIVALIITSAARNKPIADRWLSELTHRLESAVLQANLWDQLNAIVTCQMKGSCKLPRETLENLLNSPLRNPLLSGKNRAATYSALSYYLVNIASDYPGALVAMQKGIEAAPQELEYRLTLIKFLIALQRFSEAAKQLALLEQLDKLRIYAPEIEQIRKTLSDAESK